ncbi:MAG: glycosyltransferase [Alphaproteobacteria bacterium]|nr:glycosyltransferase [Alphaproteobacteria bacterium]
MSALKVLCLDIEGGRGGSSRSLLQALSALDRRRVAPTVVCRRGGWIEEAYRALEIPCRIEPETPTLTALHRTSRNLAVNALFRMRDWPRSAAFRERLLQAVDESDLVHLNHISLTPLAGWMRRLRPAIPVTLHIRTMPVRSVFASRQARAARAACDGFAFITENERLHFESQAGGAAPGAVIYNPAQPIPPGTAPLDAIPADDRLKVACLSNYSHSRGIDRLVDVAAALPEAARRRILFIVAGDMRLTGRLPGALGDVARRGGTLADHAAACGVASSFLFLGHVTEPERVLAAADVLVKPTREANPWGRDILEAMAAGVPVASVGWCDRFVESGETGLLQPRFDAPALADWLTAVDGDRTRLRALGERARRRAETLCAPPRSAAALVDFWERTARGEVVEGQAREGPTPARSTPRLAGVLPSFAGGGAERVVLSLLRGVKDAGGAAELIALDGKGPLADKAVGLDRVQVLDRRRLRRAAPALIGAIRWARPEVLFASQAHLNAGLLFLKPLLGSVRLVVREANMPSACLANGHWPGWFKPLYRRALRRADLVIATSQQMALEFERDFRVRPERLRVVYNPVDEAEIRDAAAAGAVRRPGTGRRFVAAGRLVRQKGFGRLVEWMAAMDAADHLTILGEGPERRRLERLIAGCGVENRVDLAGYSGDAWRWMAGADALLMSSLWEGMPNAALEALAVGAPVIATAESGAIAEVAALAPPGAVRVAKDGPGFIAAMRAVRPGPAGLRASLLPQDMQRDRAVAAFAAWVGELAR